MRKASSCCGGEKNESSCGCGCECECGCCTGGKCACGGGGRSEDCCCEGSGFKRRFQTKAEQVAELQAYLAELKAEVEAVEEHIADLKRKK